ncbi:MAG: flippase-like domain-containing protein [Caldilineaceae bacterium]|nr:flippase-like domain-containing protein [Caldilineaceae bacterium]
MKNRTLPFIEIAIGLSLLILLFVALRTVSPAAVWAVLQRTDPWQVAGLLLYNVFIVVLLADRWWIILRGIGERVSYLRLVEFRLIGATISQLTPGPQFGGEPAQIHLLTRVHVPAARAIASVTLEKALELVANFGVLVIMVLYVLLDGVFGSMLGWSAPAVAVFLLLLPLVPLIVLWRGGRPVTVLLNWATRLLPLRWRVRVQQRAAVAVHSAEDAIHDLLRRRPRVALLALGVSFFNWAVMIAEYWLATRVLHMDLAFVEVIALLVAARVAFLLPMPGGLGTLEAGQVFTLILLGHDPAGAIGLSLLMRLRDLLVVTAGLILAWRNGWRRHSAPVSSLDAGLQSGEQVVESE